MKRTLALLLAFMVCLSLGACGDVTADTVRPTEPLITFSTTVRESTATEPAHTHEWTPATCTEPKTCKICQATEGEATGHDWKDATCTEPKTCACGATEGSAKGHDWTPATCTAPKICKTCQATEGEATGHDWKDATCTEPKTCACGATEGSAKGHDWKDATCAEPKTCSLCAATTGVTAGHRFVSGKCTTCGTADPSVQQGNMVWIPTKGGKKYHTNPDCSNMIDPEQVTEDEAEDLGFTPCKRCH